MPGSDAYEILDLIFYKYSDILTLYAPGSDTPENVLEPPPETCNWAQAW